MHKHKKLNFVLDSSVVFLLRLDLLVSCVCHFLGMHTKEIMQHMYCNTSAQCREKCGIYYITFLAEFNEYHSFQSIMICQRKFD